MHSAALPSPATTKPAQHAPLLVVLAAFAAGIVVDRLLPLSAWFWILLAFSAATAWTVLWRRGATRLAMATLPLALTAAGGWWHHDRWNHFAPDELGLFARPAPEPVCLEAVALGAPHHLPAPPPDPLRTLPAKDQSRLELSVTGIRDGRTWRSASGLVTLMVSGRLQGVRAGDRLRVVGRLAAAGQPANPSEFDYAAHKRAERRLCRVWAGFPAAVTVVAPGSRWSMARLLDHLRSRGATLLERTLASERAPLASAMFLGVYELPDPKISQAFLETGTIHLLTFAPFVKSSS